MIPSKFSNLKIIEFKDFKFLEQSPIEILNSIGGPFVVLIPGIDNSRTRVISALIHGNEPSGYFGMLNWLKLKKTPQTNTYFLVSGVGAALTKPYFTNRVMISGQDLNRCFFPPFNNYEGNLAQEILEFIGQIKPEAVIDIHNTSGRSPDFGICMYESELNFKLANMFTTKCLVINLQLGTLVEALSKRYNCVTIECGNANHPLANEIALRGIDNFLTTVFLEAYQPNDKLSILNHPVRLELQSGKKVVYTNEKDIIADIIMPADVDKLNSEKLEPGTKIAFIPNKSFKIFHFYSNSKTEKIEDYFYLDNAWLKAKIPLHLIMVTTNPVIAQKDCLFWVAKD